MVCGKDRKRVPGDHRSTLVFALSALQAYEWRSLKRLESRTERCRCSIMHLLPASQLLLNPTKRLLYQRRQPSVPRNLGAGVLLTCTLAIGACLYYGPCPQEGRTVHPMGIPRDGQRYCSASHTYICIQLKSSFVDASNHMPATLPRTSSCSVRT